MNKPDLNIIKSPEAERMLQMVTQGFYNRSFMGLWMFEVIGREYDEMTEWSELLKYEIFPQTCTWSIPIWEWVYEIKPDDTLTLEYRRQRIMAKRLSHPPINPDRIGAVLSALAGCPVTITDPIAPYMFRVIMDESEHTIFSHAAVLKLLRTIKPSHLSFRCEVIIIREYSVTEYSACAESVYIRSYSIEESEIETEKIEYSAVAAAMYISEYHLEEIEIETEKIEYNAVAASEYIKEVCAE